MKKIILDTNMMLSPVQFKSRVYDDVTAEFYTVDRCMEELEQLSRKKTKTGMHAKAALILAKTKKVNIIKTGGKTDESIIQTAKNGNYIVATNDKDLIKALKNLNIRIMRLKQKKLIIEE